MGNRTLVTCGFVLLLVLLLAPVSSQGADVQLGYYAGIVAQNICGGYEGAGQGACRQYLSFRFDQGYNKNQARFACEQDYCNDIDFSSHAARQKCWDACNKMLADDN